MTDTDADVEDPERETDGDPGASPGDAETAAGSSETSTGEAGSSTGDVEEVDTLLARVAAVDEELAAEVGDLSDRVAELESELETKEARVEELESSLRRTKADFQNYKKRTEKRKEQIRERATEDLVERLIDVRDNLVRALQQDADADIRDGVEATLSTFDRVLEDENVEPIHPEPGAEVDPQVHEVMMRVEGDQPEGTVQDVYRPGYRMAGKVLQAAQVTVSEGEDDGGPAGSDGTAEEESADE